MSTFLEGTCDRFILKVQSSTSQLPSEACVADIAINGKSAAFHETVRDRGWAVLELMLEDEGEAELLSKWQEVFQDAFSQEENMKVAGGKYRSVKKLPVGFRRDDEREFFESRVFKDKQGLAYINPLYSTCQYEQLVRLLFSLQRRVARIILRSLLRAIGINHDAVIDLTDLKDPLENGETSEQQIEDGEISDVSSSLLRVCSYPALQADAPLSDPLTDTDPTDKGVVFGSHTDTSVLTLGMCSSDPGLELYDRQLKRWVNGELVAQQSCIASGQTREERGVPLIVFVGEVLQVLTRAYYRATIHRVRAPRAGTRISCPFIIRGKWGRTINMRNGQNLESDGEGEEEELESYYAHPGGNEVLKKYTPDLDGSDVSLVHKILDLKRAKCRRRNENATSDWVLAAELEVLGEEGEA